MRILAALTGLSMILCAAVIVGSLWAMWRLPVRQDWALFNAPRGYITASRSTRSASEYLILDGDGISCEYYGRLESTDTQPGWHVNFHDHALDNLNATLSLFRPRQTHTWMDGAGLYLFTGTRVHPTEPTKTARTLIVRIPYWLIITLAAVFPMWLSLRYLLRRRRYGAGLCPNCGYDLRATPMRCPECGAEFAEPAIKADDRR